MKLLLVRLQRALAHREQFLLYLFTQCKPNPGAPTYSGNANCSRTLLRLQVQHIIAFSRMYNNGQKILLITSMIQSFFTFPPLQCFYFTRVITCLRETAHITTNIYRVPIYTHLNSALSHRLCKSKLLHRNHAKKILAYKVHESNICTLTNYYSTP